MPAFLFVPVLLAAFGPVTEAGLIEDVCYLESDTTGTCRMRWVQTHHRNLDGWDPFMHMIVLPQHNLALVGGVMRETPNGGSCTVVADDLHSGETQWRFSHSNDPTWGDEVVALESDREGQKVYVACTTGTRVQSYFALEASTGEVIWEHRIPKNESVGYPDLTQISASDDGTVWLLRQADSGEDHPCWGPAGEIEIRSLDGSSGRLLDIVRISLPDEPWDEVYPIDMVWSPTLNELYISVAWSEWELERGYICWRLSTMGHVMAYNVDDQVTRELFRSTYDDTYEVEQTNASTLLVRGGGDLNMINISSGNLEWRYAPGVEFSDYRYDSVQNAVYVAELREYAITKLDASSGSTVWSHDYGVHWDRAWDVDVSEDGERVFATGLKYKTPNLPNRPDSDQWTLEINAEGEVAAAMRYSHPTHNQNTGLKLDYVDEQDVLITAGLTGLGDDYCCDDTYYTTVAYDMGAAKIINRG